MADGRTEAYEGARAFAFVSYCHKDDAAVLPIIESLVRAGVRVWYDEGINPGEEWPLVIQEHLERCSVFVAFVSAASQVSHSCRKELNEALTLKKPTIPVMLEECEKSVATRALLARLQALKCTEYDSVEACVPDLAHAIAKMCPDAVEGGAPLVLSGETSPDAGEGGALSGNRAVEGAEEGRASEEGSGTEATFPLDQTSTSTPAGDGSAKPIPTRRKRRTAIAIVATLAALLIAAVVAFAALSPQSDTTAPFWGVWVAATQDQESAKAQSDELSNLGFDAIVVQTNDWSNLNADEWYAVSAGCFASREEAEAQLEKAVAAGYDTAYVKHTGSYLADGRQDAESSDSAEMVKIVLNRKAQSSVPSSGSSETTQGSSSAFSSGSSLPSNEGANSSESASDVDVVGDLADDLATVKERFNIFAGEGACAWSEDSGRYVVELPTSSFGNLDIRHALCSYLVRPIEVYLSKTANGVPSRDVESIPVPRSCIKSVAIEDGPLPDLDTSAFDEDFPEDYKVVRMTLTDDFVKKNAKKLDEWGNDLAVSQDLGYASDYYYYGSVVREGNDVRFVDNCQGKIPSLLKLIEYNYTHDTLSDGFRFTVDIESLVDWEEPGSESPAGENQVPSSELSGKLVVLEYSDGAHASTDDIAEGVQLDMDTGLKRRFDALGIPYAFGHLEEAVVGGGVKRCAVIEALQDSVFVRDVYAMANHGSTDYTLFFDGYEATAYLNATSFDLDQEARGGWRIAVEGKNSLTGDRMKPTDDIVKFSSHLSEGDPVSFLFNSFTVLVGTYRGTNDLGGLLFDDIRAVDGTPVADGDSLVPLEFFRACVETQNLMPGGLAYEGCLILEDGMPLIDAMLNTEDLAEYDEIVDGVKEAVPGSEVYFDQPKLKVGLNLPVDDDLPERGLALARKVFEAVGYKHAEFSDVIVYLIDEEKTEDERARISFYRTKDYETGEPKITCYVMVGGGRLDAYGEKINALAADDPFYSDAMAGVAAEKL